MKNKYNRIGACMLPVVALGFIITMWPQSGFGGDANEPLVTAAPLRLGPSPRRERAEAGQNTWAKYQIILQRNIFSRQRVSPRQKQRQRPQRVVTPNPESYFLLKGIVKEGGTFIAFLEDTRSNGVLKLHEGDSVARGVIKNFTLDSIEYQMEDRTISVALGRDLEGGQGTITMNRLLELSVTSMPTGDQEGATEEPIPSEDEAEILRQLMEQRRQQLGQ